MTVKNKCSICGKTTSANATCSHCNKQKVTVYCQRCNKEILTTYKLRNKQYCSEKCAETESTGLQTISQCLVCQKYFYHYGSKVTCGKVCTARYVSQQQFGISDKILTNTCLTCHKEFSYNFNPLYADQQRVYCSLKCSMNTLEKPETIVQLNHCVLCGETQDLVEKHSVPLCQKCSPSVQDKDHAFWNLLFQLCLSGCRLVPKVWGGEIHVVNHYDYCLKYLFFYQDCSFSNHWHNIKKELWMCLVGQFEVVLTTGCNKEYTDFRTGDIIELLPKTIHQVRAVCHSILVEVSTQSFNEDSHKINSLLYT